MIAASIGAVEDLTTGRKETATVVRHLVDPTGKTGNFWDFYKLYDPIHHPDLQDLAHCTLCQTDISIKGRTTTGLNKHLRHKHREQYELINENKAVVDPSVPSVSKIIPKKKQQQQQQQQQRKLKKQRTMTNTTNNLHHRAPHATLLPPPQVRSIVTAWLQDDMPSNFDVGGYVVGTTVQRAELWMKSSGVLAGLPFVEAVFDVCGECTVHWEDIAMEGQSYDVSTSGKIKLATITGPVSHLLRGERTALNTLSRCSGVATLSAKCVAIAKSHGWKGEVAGTRKTTPGFRLVEKYGLLVGGASTHRLDLSQMVMLKDNHIWSCGGCIDAAVKKARGVSGFSQKIEVECQNLDEACIAAKAGADVIMLDNYTPDRLKVDAKAFKERFPHVTVEASGGITIETMSGYFCEQVDVISQGALTQGYDCLDFSLKIVH